ncbi:MAG: adenylosuccinate lyase [Acidobacteria bacterium]|nr:adenylosuccinate lyase [Acidobacteriota bacterium]
MIGRYTRPEMGSIWGEAAQYATWLEVEVAVAEVMAALGHIPSEALDDVRRAVPPDPERVAEIERRTGHDVIAFLEAVEEQIGASARYLHLGLTSSDVLDTSLALRCARASDLLIAGCDALVELFMAKALEYRDQPMVGRTHGIHAEPITLGLKFLRYYEEFRRASDRLRRAREVMRFGQISGAVGSYGTLDPAVEAPTCAKLGLKVEPVSSQVVPRDRHAEFLSHLAVVAASIENVALEIRGLQRTEVLEAAEPFGKGQKGSSVMPHKRNPIKCENLVGLARLVRAYAVTGFENVALWHERDISHSSVERVAIADACIVLDFMQHRLYGVIDGLDVYPEAMERNLNLTNGLVFSSRVLEALLRANLARTEAYHLVQRAAMTCWETGEPLKELLAADAEVMGRLSTEDLDQAFDIKAALSGVEAVYERIIGDDGAGADDDRRSERRRKGERRDDERRSGRDRRYDAAVARGEGPDRREGSDRREEDERRDEDRRSDDVRRAGSERRGVGARRSSRDRRDGSDDSFDGEERRDDERRSEPRRRVDK